MPGQKVRGYLAEHPDAGPTEVARALNQYGVSVALVSSVKGRTGKGRHKKREAKSRKWTVRGRKGRSRSSAQAEPIVAAAELIRLCGGVEEARTAVETAGRVASTLQ